VSTETVSVPIVIGTCCLLPTSKNQYHSNQRARTLLVWQVPRLGFDMAIAVAAIIIFPLCNVNHDNNTFITIARIYKSILMIVSFKYVFQ